MFTCLVYPLHRLLRRALEQHKLLTLVQALLALAPVFQHFVFLVQQLVSDHCTTKCTISVIPNKHTCLEMSRLHSTNSSVSVDVCIFYMSYFTEHNQIISHKLISLLRNLAKYITQRNNTHTIDNRHTCKMEIAFSKL